MNVLLHAEFSSSDCTECVLYSETWSNVELLIRSQRDLIGYCFKGLSSAYFTRVCTFSVESMVGLLISTEESSTKFIGTVIPIQALQEICRGILSINCVESFMKICTCYYSIEVLRYQQNSVESNSLNTAVELPVSQLWEILILAEVFEVDRVTLQCKKQLRNMLLHHSNDKKSLPPSCMKRFNLQHKHIIESSLLAHLLKFGVEDNILSSDNVNHSIDRNVNAVNPLITPIHNNSNINTLSSSSMSGNTTSETTIHLDESPVIYSHKITPETKTIHVKSKPTHTIEERTHIKPIQIVNTPLKESFNDQRSQVPWESSCFDDDNDHIFNNNDDHYAIEQEYMNNIHNNNIQDNNNKFNAHYNNMVAEDNYHEEYHEQSAGNDYYHTNHDQAMSYQDLHRDHGFDDHNNQFRHHNVEVDNTNDDYHHYEPQQQQQQYDTFKTPNRSSISSQRNSINYDSSSPYGTKPAFRYVNINRNNSKNKSTLESSVDKKRSSLTPESLQVSREIALLRLKEAKVKADVEKSKQQAEQTLRENRLKSLALKTAVLRIGQKSPSSNSSSSYSNNPSFGRTRSRSSSPALNSTTNMKGSNGINITHHGPGSRLSVTLGETIQQAQIEEDIELAKMKALVRLKAKRHQDELQRKQREAEEKQREQDKAAQRETRIRDFLEKQKEKEISSGKRPTSRTPSPTNIPKNIVQFNIKNNSNEDIPVRTPMKLRNTTTKSKKLQINENENYYLERPVGLMYSREALEAVGLGLSPSHFVLKNAQKSPAFESEHENGDQLAHPILETSKDFEAREVELINSQRQSSTIQQDLSTLPVQHKRSISNVRRSSSSKHMFVISVVRAHNLPDCLGGTNAYILVELNQQHLATFRPTNNNSSEDEDTDVDGANKNRSNYVNNIQRQKTAIVHQTIHPEYNTQLLFPCDSSSYLAIQKALNAFEQQLQHAENSDEEIDRDEVSYKLRLSVYNKNDSISDEVIGMFEMNAVELLFFSNYQGTKVYPLYGKHNETAGCVELSAQIK